MRKLFVILLLFISIAGYSQKQYIPWLQTDDTHVLSNFVLNGDTFRITGPANGQIIQRVSGKWINVPSPASVFDSLVWNPATGDLVSWKDGSPFSTENLDGRYAVNDGNVGDMLKAIYDTAMISEQVVGLTASQTLSNKVLIIPTIANYTNAQHNHSSAATGGLISSDNITQGTVNFFSRWGKNANTIYYNTGSVAIGKTTAGSALDVVGTTTTQGLAITSTITFDGLTITDVQPGSTDNNHLVTKGYVDEQIISAGGYTDEQAQDAIGPILDDGTLGDVIFTYDDLTPKISAEVENDSHAHTGSTVSGLTTSNFTSQSVSQWSNDANYLTGTTGNLTENITGMEFSATRQVIGGAAQLSLSTGYVIPTTTEQSNWTAGYNDKINSAAFSGTTTKTLTLTQQDAGTVTANFTDLNTTYAVSAETATGGANLRLTGSDSSTDDVKLAGAGSVTVSRPDANTISISGTDSQSLSFNSGTGELSISGGNAVTIPLSSGGDNWGSQVVISDITISGDGTSLSPLSIDTAKIATIYDLSQLPSDDTNTTYSISSEIVSGGANLRLSGSNNTTDDIKILGDGDITVTRTDENTITVGSSLILNDNDSTNEVITAVSYANDTLSITEAGLTHKVNIQAGTTGVTSFNTRTGAVIPATDDYTASMVTNAAATNVSNVFTADQWVTKVSPYYFARYTSASSGAGFVVADNSLINRMTFGFNSTAEVGYIFSQYNYPFRIMLNNVEQSRFNTNGVLELRNLSSSPSTGQANFGGFYVKNNLPYFINASGVEYDLTASGSGTSQWNSDTYGIYYANNVGIGTLSASNSAIALDVYKSISGGYAGSFTNPSTSGNGLVSHIGSTSDTYMIGKFMSSNGEKLSVTGGGAVKIIERSTPGTPGSGYGYIYATTDNKLYFKNDAGTEYDLTAAGSGSTLWQEDGNYLKPLNTLRNVMINNAQPSLRFVDSDFATQNFSIDLIGDQLRLSYYNGANYYDHYINQYGFYGGQYRLYNSTSYEEQNGVIRYNGTDILGRVGGVWKSLTADGGSGTGTVTSVSAGNGMNFTTITATGTVTMGTPSSITTSSTNSATSGTHTHTLDLSGRSVLTTNSLTGGGTLAANRTIQLVNDTATPGANKVYGTDSLGVRRWTQSQNMTVLTLSGTSVLWDVKNGVNAKIDLTGNTTITMKNLVPGSTGNLTVYNPNNTTYTLTFSGSFSYLVSPIIKRTTASPNTSGYDKIDIFSWYYDGSDIFINGTLDYGIYYR